MYSLLYSYNQKQFHVQKMEEAIKSNLEQFVKEIQGSDYRIIYVHSDQDDCLRFANFLKREYPDMIEDLDI